MESPVQILATIATSSKHVVAVVPLLRARTFSATAKVTFDGSATSGARINLYYSPDGSNFDTVVIDQVTVTLSAGNTIQRTIVIQPPEHGFLAIEIENLDSSQTLTDANVWYSIQGYDKPPTLQKGVETSRIVDGEVERKDEKTAHTSDNTSHLQ